MIGCACSTRPLFPARSRGRRSNASDLAGYAAYGYCASHSRYFWGFRLYLVCSPDGMPHGFCLAPANEPEREVAAALLDRMRADGSLHGFEIIIGDKGFAGAEFEQIVSELAAAFLRPDRRDEANATATSALSANGSNRSSTPPKASSPSNATAAAPRKASGHASANASSPSRSASGTTGRSANQAAASQPMTTKGKMTFGSRCGLVHATSASVSRVTLWPRCSSWAMSRLV